MTERCSQKVWLSGSVRQSAAAEAGVAAELIEELERRYVKRRPPQRDDAWMIDQEIRLLLSCAL